LQCTNMECAGSSQGNLCGAQKCHKRPGPIALSPVRAAIMTVEGQGQGLCDPRVALSQGYIPARSVLDHLVAGRPGHALADGRGARAVETLEPRKPVAPPAPGVLLRSG